MGIHRRGSSFITLVTVIIYLNNLAHTNLSIKYATTLHGHDVMSSAWCNSHSLLMRRGVDMKCKSMGSVLGVRAYRM